MQKVTAQTKTWRKVKTVDGSVFRVIRTYGHEVTGELMAIVVDENGKRSDFFATELRIA